MSILTFENMNSNHIEDAARLAIAEYYEERAAVPILPEGEYFDIICKLLTQLIDHNLGVAAMENGKLTGFLTCYKPWNNHFGTTLGTFSPVHAHGTVKENRCRIYSELYQAASEKWIKQGVLSHAIALYSHSKEAADSFYWNGFGLRCVDAIRGIEPIECREFPDTTFQVLPKDELEQIVPLKNLLIKHLQSTPMYIPLFFQKDIAKLKEENERRNSRYFVAKDRDETVAFIEIMGSGENFACEAQGMTNICGAFMQPQYRGSGIYTALLSFLIRTITAEGFTRCGVDFESFNPTASGFWTKYFTPYTYSVTRRIDERIVRNYQD